MSDFLTDFLSIGASPGGRAQGSERLLEPLGGLEQIQKESTGDKKTESK